MIARLSRVLAALVAAALLASAPLQAQEATDPLARLDAQTRLQIEMILDSARHEGLPTRPLLSKAYEGVSKRAEPRRILAAVRALHLSLREARGALGSSLSETEWSAAASVLQAGVPARSLARFRSDRADKPLARALVVMADLITRGVPVETASTAIFSLWQRGAGDADFYGLWRDVERDILSGANPGAALQQRAREFPGSTPGGMAPRPPEGTPST